MEGRVAYQDNRIYARCPPRRNGAVRTLPGYRWHPKLGAWSFPASIFIAEQLKDMFGSSAFEESAAWLLKELQHYYDIRARDVPADLADPPSLTNSWLHQRHAYWYIKDLRGAGIFMEMGTGKSKVAVDIVANRGDQKILVVAPKRVLNVWVREFEKHSIRPTAVIPLTRSTNRAKTNQILEYDGDFPVAFVTNYEIVWRKPLADVILDYDFDCVIADEVHRLKKPGGKASLFMSRLGGRVPYRLGLSGTPMPNSPLDIYAIYRFLDPGVFGTNYEGFESRYAIKGGYEGKQVVGYRNLDELHRRVYDIAFRVKSADVLDLPEPIFETYTLQLSRKANDIYRQMEKESIITFKESESLIADNVLTQLLRLQQITSGHLPDGDELRVVDTEKANLLKDILEDIDIREPIVIFARFRHDLQQIREVSESQGRRCAELSGQADQLEDWKKGDYDVMAVQIQAGGEGEDFTRARYAIYYSLGFSLKDYEQSRFRVLRPGQTRTPVFIHLVAENTVDEKVMKALQDKKQVIESVLDEYLEEE